MKIDDRKIPAVFFSFIVILFLLIAFYFNFLPAEIIFDDNKINDYSKGRINNINYKYSDNGDLKNKSHENTNTMYISGESEINKNVLNETLIELNFDVIYNVILPVNVDENLTLTIWNNSNSVKNIKCPVKFLINDIQETRFITIKSQKIIVIKSNGTNWILIKELNFNEIED